MTKIVAFIGYSKSGKTTLIMELTKHFRQLGSSVAVLKHTHHKLGRGSAGDSRRFLDAGAEAVIFCNDEDAILYREPALEAARRFAYGDATELLNALQTDFIFVEGFKQRRLAPTILVEREGAERMDRPAQLAAAVTDWPSEYSVPTFRAADIPAIASFVDRITAS